MLHTMHGERCAHEHSCNLGNQPVRYLNRYYITWKLLRPTSRASFTAVIFFFNLLIYLFSLLCNIPLDNDLILLPREVLGHFQGSAVLKSVLSNFSNVALGAFAQEFP